jgi:hypothetical protein
MANKRYHRLEELYRRGVELEFETGDVMWIQVMNPLEADNAREESKTAKARRVMALKEIGSDEQTKAMYDFSLLPKLAAIETILTSQQPLWLAQADEKLRDDPEWKERLEIVDRANVIQAAPPDEAERELSTKIVDEYIAEIYQRVGEVSAAEAEHLQASEETDVRDRWLELYVTRLGDEVALAEFQVTSSWYGTRVCVATKNEDGSFDHRNCGGHTAQVYDTKEDFRSAPLEVQNAIELRLMELNMTARAAKNSDSAASSSDSSAQQNTPEESTPSTPTATLSTAPGTSTLQSSMP